MTVNFLKTQEVLGEYVNKHRHGLLSEPENLLDLVRPGEPLRIKERVAIKAEQALKHPRKTENQLILSFYGNGPFYGNGLNLAFGHFNYKSWENWYPENKDHIDTILRFAKAIYKDTPDIEAYETEEEFNAALITADPEFAQLTAS